MTTASSKSSSESQLTKHVESGVGNRAASSSHYLLHHWRGDLPLGWSCWCNGLSAFLALPIVSFGVTATAHLWSERSGSLRIAALMLTVFFTFWLGLQVWSNVGMWRAAKHYLLRGGRRLWTRAARAVVVTTTAFDLALLLMAVSSPRREIAMIAWGRDPIGTIHVEVSQDGNRVLVRGNLGTGSAAELARVLRSAVHARTVELNSNGGRMYEAIAAAKEIRRRGLNTYVGDHCYSGCTFLFLAGHARAIGPNASLAFHKPGLAEIQGSPSDADDELICLKELGVMASTVNRIRNLSGDEVWYPTHDEMIEYGLITSAHVGIDRVE